MEQINLYIHIGLHKTGTTSIQNFLTLNENILSKKGYLYPATGRKGQAQHLLAQAMG